MYMNNDAIDAKKPLSVDVIIPVYHPDRRLFSILERLCLQTVKPQRIIILHTIDRDGESLYLPDTPGISVSVMPVMRKDFDHGGTRKYGASMSDADIMVFMTQDAVPADDYLIEKLIVPYWNPEVAATYARQIPGKKAGILERFTRSYNYPKTSRIKSAADLPKLGIKTYFCSNVCASYRNDAYRKLGGFVEKTIFNEDMILAFDIINSGYKIVYTAEARVLHYHNYSLIQQFQRNFDLGVSHKQYEHLFKSVKSESEGIKLVGDTLAYLLKEKKYYLIPYLFINSLCKYAGYLLGAHYNLLPQFLTERFSMNKLYWK